MSIRLEKLSIFVTFCHQTPSLQFVVLNPEVGSPRSRSPPFILPIPFESTTGFGSFCSGLFQCETTLSHSQSFLLHNQHVLRPVDARMSLGLLGVHFAYTATTMKHCALWLWREQFITMTC